MAAGSSPALKTSRNRLGCITCKIRKVKCDEEKPACRRCTSTGRKCDGYASLTRSSTPTARPLARRSPTLSDQSQPAKLSFLAHEVRALEFFQLKTVPAVGGYFHSPFWNRLVLQVATTEPAVRSAVLAVSALHRLTDDGALPADRSTAAAVYSSIPQASSEALTHYATALKLLRDRMAAGSEAIPVALVACVLFTCFESLCGNIDPALRHIRSGMDIIRSVRFPDPSMPAGTSQPPPAHLHDLVDDDILPVFGRLGIMSHTFGQPAWQLVPPDLDERPLRSTKYTTIEQARVDLNELNTYVLQVKQALNHNRYPPYPEPSPQLLSRYSRFTQRLNNWYAGLSALLARLGTSLSPSETCAVHMMRIHYFVARGWLATSLTPGECACDAHFDIFCRIVALAQCYIDITATMRSADAADQPTMQSYNFDIGLIGPLYWVATRCRHPVLRRQAIALLAHCPRREGLWVADEVERVARHIVAVEETGMWDRAENHNSPTKSFPSPGQTLQDAVQSALEILSKCANTLSMSNKASDYVQLIGDEWPLPQEHMRLHEVLIEGPAAVDPMSRYSDMRRSYDWIVAHTRDNMPFVAEHTNTHGDFNLDNYDFSLSCSDLCSNMARLSPGPTQGYGEEQGGEDEGPPTIVTLVWKPWGLEGDWKIGRHSVRRRSNRM